MDTFRREVGKHFLFIKGNKSLTFIRELISTSLGTYLLRIFWRANILPLLRLKYFLSNQDIYIPFRNPISPKRHAFAISGYCSKETLISNSILIIFRRLIYLFFSQIPAFLIKFYMMPKPFGVNVRGNIDDLIRPDAICKL